MPLNLGQSRRRRKTQTQKSRGRVRTRRQKGKIVKNDMEFNEQREFRKVLMALGRADTVLRPSIAEK